MGKDRRPVIITGIIVLLVAVCALLYFTGILPKFGNSNQSSAEGTTAESWEDWDDGLKLKIGKKTYLSNDNIKAYLLMGTDHSGNENETDPKKYSGNMADFLMVAIINKTQKTYGFLELNRDTMTRVKLIDEKGEGDATTKCQLCIAHSYGGTKEMSAENQVEAVSYLLGKFPIDGYYEINMSHIGEINHAVGGVTITMEDDLSNVDPALKKGATVTLSDKQADTYLHDRLNVDDGENTSRMRRQENYLRALFAQLGQKAEKDSDAGKKIFTTLQQDSTTNQTGDDIGDIQDATKSSENLDIITPDGEKKEGKSLTDGLVHAQFYMDKDSLAECLTKLCNLREAD